MHTVTVRLEAVEFSAAMTVIRGWLDHNGYETTRFDCHQNGDKVVVSIDFRVDTAAQAFARRFDGEDRR